MRRIGEKGGEEVEGFWSGIVWDRDCTSTIALVKEINEECWRHALHGR